MALPLWIVNADIKIMSWLGGKDRETLSSASWNAHLTNVWWGWTYLVIDLLLYVWQRDHSRLDWEYRKEIYQ
jgi:hypothetical protein